jgi:nucleotide-binding universal stress UspA family protein
VPPKLVVVVGIDGSPQSRAALSWAVRYAELIGARVRAVAVWHQPMQFAEASLAPMSEDFANEARRWLADALPDDTGEGSEPQVEIETRIEQGEPTHVLLGHASTAELLVLGNHGRSPLGAMVLGSVAQRCAHHAPCPLLLVPTPP